MIYTPENPTTRTTNLSLTFVGGAGLEPWLDQVGFFLGSGCEAPSTLVGVMRAAEAQSVDLSTKQGVQPGQYTVCYKVAGQQGFAQVGFIFLGVAWAFFSSSLAFLWRWLGYVARFCIRSRLRVSGFVGGFRILLVCL